MKTKQDLKQWIAENSFSIEDQAGVKMIAIDADELKAFVEHSPEPVDLKAEFANFLQGLKEEFPETNLDYFDFALERYLSQREGKDPVNDKSGFSSIRYTGNQDLKLSDTPTNLNVKPSESANLHEAKSGIDWEKKRTEFVKYFESIGYSGEELDALITAFNWCESEIQKQTKS